MLIRQKSSPEISYQHTQLCSVPNQKQHILFLNCKKKPYLGIWSAISSKLSDGFIGVFSKRRDGANVKLFVESLFVRNTLAPRRCRWRCCADFLRLFSCSRCKLCNRKKNIDILFNSRELIDQFFFFGQFDAGIEFFVVMRKTKNVKIRENKNKKLFIKKKKKAGYFWGWEVKRWKIN